MRRRSRHLRRFAWAAVGLASIGGCLANVQSNLDLVFAPEAAGNLLRLTVSPLVGLAQVVSRLLG